MTEVWKAIPGYEGIYEVSDLGNVRSLTRWTPHKGGPHLRLRPGAPMRPSSTKRYYQVKLCRDGHAQRFLVHQLVLTAFVGPCPDGEQGRHMNGQSFDNRLTNLEYGTPKQNADDMERHRRRVHGRRIHSAVLTPDAVRRIRASHPGQTKTSLAEHYGVHITTISDVISGHTWARVS